MKYTLYYEEKKSRVKHFAIESKNIEDINNYAQICSDKYIPVLIIDNGVIVLIAEVRTALDVIKIGD